MYLFKEISKIIHSKWLIGEKSPARQAGCLDFAPLVPIIKQKSIQARLRGKRGRSNIAATPGRGLSLELHSLTVEKNGGKCKKCKIQERILRNRPAEYE
jgi:hypothetical protein